MEIKHRLQKDVERHTPVHGEQNFTLANTQSIISDGHFSTSDRSNLILDLQESWDPGAYGNINEYSIMFWRCNL